MKKTISLILALLLVLSLAACSSKTPDEPGEAVLEADVEKYIQEVIDETATVTSFEKVDSGISDDTLKVTCKAAYEGDSAEGENTFVLTYKLEKGEWVMSKCRMELDEEEKETAKAVGTVKMSDNLFDFTFKLDGTVYQLPCKYSDFTANGWKLKENNYDNFTEESTIKANSYEQITIVKNSLSADVCFINMTGNAVAIKDCKVGGINVSASQLTDSSLFEIAKGINLTSTIDDITAAFGSPNKTNSYDDYSSLQYNDNSDDYDIRVGFQIYNEGKTKNNTIDIRNFVSDESDVTETSDKVPDYLSQYKAPEELGTDMKSGNIEIDGDVYCLPAPVSVFVENGWKISSQSNGVGAGNSDYLTLQRNDKKLDVSIMNFADYQALPENCAVFDIDAYGFNNSAEVKLPGGLVVGQDKASAEAMISGFCELYDGSSSYNYSYDDYENGFSLDVSIDKEDLTVDHIGLQYRDWHYGS